jgi:protein arginine N-methyltransferase 1
MAADGLPHRVRYERPVVDAGRVDGFCLFYKVAFDAELSFSVSPLRGQNHAGMTLLRVDSREFERFDTLRFELDLVDPGDVRTWRWAFT